MDSFALLRLIFALDHCGLTVYHFCVIYALEYLN